MDAFPRYRCALVREGYAKIEHGLRGPVQAAAALRECIPCDADREHAVVLLLDVNNRIIGAQTVGVGILTGAMVHPREVFKPAILAGAASIVFGHNHPSGSMEPSAEDIEVTAQIAQSGMILGIPLRDHVIISHMGYLSMQERGLLRNITDTSNLTPRGR